MLGRNLAVQFHPELDEKILAGWLTNGGDDDARKLGIDPDTLLADTRRNTVDSRIRAHQLVDAFLARASAAMSEGPGHEFRQAAGRFASGVTVVTTEADDGAYGVTVSSFASLSLNPLLVTVSINRTSPLIGYVRSRRAFAVSVLASDQQQVADYFARSGRRPEPDGFRSVARERAADRGAGDRRLPQLVRLRTRGRAARR